MRTILFLILNLAGLVLLVQLIRNIVTNYKRTRTNKPLQNWLYNHAILLIIIVAGPLILVHTLAEEPNLSTIEKRINHRKQYENYFLLADAFRDTVRRSPGNVNLNFMYVSTFTDYIKTSRGNSAYRPKQIATFHESKNLILHYQGLIKNDSSLKDLARTMLAYHLTDLEQTRKAFPQLDSVSNKNSSAFKLVLAKTIFAAKKRDRSQETTLLSNGVISDSFQLKKAYNLKAHNHYYYNKTDSLAKMVYDSRSSHYLDSFWKRIVYFRDGAVGKYIKEVVLHDLSKVHILGFIAALFILLVWLVYLRRVDVYEPEKWVHILMTLGMSMITIYWIYPLGDFLRDVLGFFPSGYPVEGFFRMTVNIGVIEELVKIVPVLIMLRFTKAINEPFDYILYASVSALGFAFVENLGYIQQSSLYNINGRALMAAVGHMVFSSTIGYGLMLIEYGKVKKPLFIFTISFLLAATMHGFYDFWLLHWSGKGYEWLTDIFLILSVHVWFVYCNNTLNISTFYNPKIVLRNDQLKYFLITGLLGIFMYSYLVNSFMEGPNIGSQRASVGLFMYGFLLLYISFSMSRFEIIKGYFAPFYLPLNFLIPRVKSSANYKGVRIRIGASKKYSLLKKFDFLKTMLPTAGILEDRFVVNDQLDAYIIRLTKPLNSGVGLLSRIVLKPKHNKNTLNDSGNILCYLYLIPDENVLEKMRVSENDLIFAGWVLSQKQGVESIK